MRNGRTNEVFTEHTSRIPPKRRSQRVVFLYSASSSSLTYRQLNMWERILSAVLAILSSSKLCLGHSNYSDVTSKHRLKWNRKCTMVPVGINYNSRQGKTYQTIYESYLAFYTCEGWSCDKTVTRAVRMDDYFRATSGCVQDYCRKCDDEHCSWDCGNYAKMTSLTSDEGNGTYNGCSMITSTEGLSYYYGPQCTTDGHVTMGYFFDKHCQISATRRRSIYSPESFISFDVFRFVQSICSDCKYYGVCQGIYNSSFACMGNNGTFLWTGNDIMLVDTLDADGYKSHNEEIYNDGGYKNEIEEEEETRASTFEYAEKICMEVNALEHMQEKVLRNITMHFIRESSIIIFDLFTMASICAAIAGVVFLFVAHSYYARHHARWAQERVEPFNDCNSIDEVLMTSTSDGTSGDEESVPVPSA